MVKGHMGAACSPAFTPFILYQFSFSMKKLLLLLAFAASASAAQAQARAGGNMASTDYTGGKTTDSRNTGFGVKGGYNYSNLRGDDISGIDRDGHSDFHAGIYGQLGFNSFSSLQVELLYSRQGFGAKVGATTTGGVTTAASAQDFRTDYLMLPVLYVGNVTDNISFHIGPQVALLTKARSNGNDYKLDALGFNSFDYGGAAGVEARVGPARVGARYNLFLSKIFTDPIPTSVTNGAPPADRIDTRFGGASIYNNMFQVYVGIGLTQ